MARNELRSDGSGHGRNSKSVVAPATTNLGAPRPDSPETYLALVVDRGWPPDQFAEIILKGVQDSTQTGTGGNATSNRKSWPCGEKSRISAVVST